MADYSCLALELNDWTRVIEEVNAVRRLDPDRKVEPRNLKGVPALQQLAYLEKLSAHPDVVPEANFFLIHVASLSVHISPDCPGHSELGKTWKRLVKLLNIEEEDEENTQDRDLSRVTMDLCVRLGLTNALEGMVNECTVLVDKKSVNINMKRAYTVSGWLVRHVSTILNTSSLKSLHHIFAPSYALAEDWKPKVEELSSLALALPDFMRGLASLEDFQANTTTHRYVEEILRIYIRVPQWPSDQHHPFAFLMTSEVKRHVREVVLTKLLNLARKNSKLKKDWDITINVLKLIRSNVVSRVVMLQVQNIFFPFLLQLLCRDDFLSGDVGNPKHCAKDLLCYIVKQDFSLVLDWLEEHIVKNLCGDYPRKFGLLGRLVDDIKPELGKSLIKPLQREVDRIDKQRGGVSDQKLRTHLVKFEDDVYKEMSKQKPEVLGFG